MSQDTSEWKDLIKWTPAFSAEGVVRLQTVPTGTGNKINLDYYSITFRRPASGGLGDFFLSLRRRFPLFTHGDDSPYGGSIGYYLKPYGKSMDGSDQSSQHNSALWDSAEPKGAVMAFHLSSANYRPALILVATTQGKTISFGEKRGDVAATCSTPTDFIFTTLETLRGSKHPVSGNRGFGLKDNSDGTWTFYTKGADRESDSSLNPPLKAIDGPDTIFLHGHAFWLQFFGNLRAYLDAHGTPVVDGSITTNSHRYDYPLE
jgi:hypothetical protein